MRPRDPRRLLERDRRALGRVTIVEVPQSGYAEDGSLGSRQVAEVTVPRAELEKIWRPEYLERLARTYWSFLSRFSLGLIRVLYSEDSRDVVFLRRPFVLLRFHKPEYQFDADGGTVTWPINRGVLVATARARARLPAAERPPQAGGGRGRRGDRGRVVRGRELLSRRSPPASAAGSTSRRSCAST